MSTIITTQASRARRWVIGSAVPRWLKALLPVALAVTGIQAAGAAPALAAVAARAPSSGPVSNAFAMGGGVGGSVDQRTGAFQASVPLLNVTGPAGTGLSLALSYDQSLAALGAAGNRFGLGAGWTLGVPWVDTTGGVHVYPASGGSYSYDSSQPTGLADYPLQDLTFIKNPGKTQPPPGVAVRPYLYSLTTLDGTTDRFDAQGNLIEQVDRFGNAIDLAWQPSGSWWQPVSVTDSYGQVTKFGYAAGTVTVTSPPNAEGITATTTLHLDSGRLIGVSDALGQTTSFGYAHETGPADGLLNLVTSPTGEHTAVTYTSPVYEPNLAVVNTVDVTDRGNPVLPELRFNINPGGDSQHNYTGYPDYNQNGPNGLFDSGDTGYRYTTELSKGTSTVDATYNSLHLMVAQKVYLHPPGGAQVLSQAQAYTYPDVPSPANLPANYAKPTSLTVTYGDPQFGLTRKITTSSAFNNQGLQTSATNADGTTTTTSYGSYGLPLKQTVTGKDGATSETTDTLTGDGKSIKTVTIAVGATAATATARTVATYDYNSSGQVTGESRTWAPGAKPTGDSGGPDHIDDTQQISVNAGAHTQTDTVTTAAGTPQAATITTVTDLVTGEVLSRTTPGNTTAGNLTTSYTYDALGRQLTRTAPGGQTTKTVYDSPTQTTVTAPSGLETRTTTDVLGRTVKVTDNVHGQQLVADPAARTLETDTYSPDGTQQATTTPAGTTTTTFDPLGRPTRIVDPGGITQTDSYNDVANTQTVKLLAAGATSPTSVTTDTFSDLNAPTGSSTDYTDHTPSAPASETYDGLGRVASFTASNVTSTVGYPGAGGLQSQTTLTPGDTSTFPGQPVTAGTGNTMTGAMTTKTLSEQAATRRAKTAADGPATGSTYTYNAAGQIDTTTDPAGHTTRYTYTPGGQINTVTTPSGTVTTYSYDKDTGRLTGKDVRAPDGSTQATAYTYDLTTGRVKSVYDPNHPADAITYDYDADGHVTAVHYPDGTSTAASYDDNGNLATSTDTTGAVTTYTYNPNAGQAGSCGSSVTELCQAVQTRDGSTLASIGYTYDSLDRVHTITRGNGVTTTIDYTDSNLVKTETTTAPDGSLLRRDDYTYDSHGNIHTHTITSAPPAQAGNGRAGRTGAAAPATTTTTTAYGYDAYNRLISSTVYDGATDTGTPATATSYTVSLAGDVTGAKTTAGTTTTTTANTIDGGRLTARDTDGTVTRQDFDTDGNVTKDLAGDIYTYNPAGQIASVTTPAGAKTSYSYWPDGTRRAATTSVNGVDHAITYHYTTTGQIANDTYTGGGPAITASYLMAVNRAARTLAPATGAGRTTQASGQGAGYYLTDAHGSAVALTGDQGQVTASYAYGDYGQSQGASTALLPTPAPDPAGNAAVNPFSYDGAYTNPATGTQYLTARTYDPAQGRFLSLDAADQLNRYQAFNTNPILNTDPTGQYAVPDWLVDSFAAAVFIAFGILSLGSGLPVLGAAAGITAAAEGAAEVTGAAIGAAALETAAGVTNIAAGATSATLFADDVASLGGHGFLSDTDKDNLKSANFVLGTAGGLFDVGAGIIDWATRADEAASAATALTDSQAGLDVGTSEISTSSSDSSEETGILITEETDGGTSSSGATDILLTEETDGGSFVSSDQGPLPTDATEPSTPHLPGTTEGGGGLQELVASEPLSRVDPMIDQAKPLIDMGGQDEQLNPTTPPAAAANAVPGTLTLGSQPLTGAPVPAGSVVATGTGLISETTTSTQKALSGNTPLPLPQPQANLTEENLPPSVLSSQGLSTENGPS